MNERLDLFSTPVLKAYWPNAQEMNASLMLAIQERKKTSMGINRSNVGGWHSSTDMAIWAGPPAINLAEFATDVVGNHMMDIHPKGKRRFNWSVEMWANVNPPGAANQLHCHPGALWSGVYYLDPGGSEDPNGGGELILEDPRFPSAYMSAPDLVLKTVDGEPMRSQSAVRPQNGLLVMFPGWLRHSVNQHRGKNPRVSIALNLMVGLAPPEA